MTLRPLVWIAVGLAAVGLLLFLALDPGVGSAAVAAPAEPLAAAPQPAAPAELPLPAEEPRAAAPVERRPEPAAPEAAAPPAPAPLVGAVVDARGVPLAGVEVGLRAGTATARTDSAGRFELAGASSVLLHLVDPRLALLCIVPAEGREDGALLVAAPAVALAGTVVDTSGAGVARARLQVVLPAGALRDFPLPLDAAVDVTASGRSDDEGRFALERAPALPGARLVCSAPDHDARTEEVPPADRSDLWVVLRRTADDPQSLHGIVLRANGLPAAGARVVFGHLRATADERGAFALALPPTVEAETPLAAGAPDAGSTVLERFGEVVLAARPDAPAPVTLVLGERALAIAGRVVDEDGRPLPGWGVSLADGTPVTRRSHPPTFAESLDRIGPRVVETDAEGCFELGGLLLRDYALEAHDPQTLLTVRAGPFRAGEEQALVRVARDLVHGTVAGVVVSRLDGTPIAGARVQVCRTTSSSPGGSSWVSGRSAETDADGRFELADVPREGAFLAVGGDVVVPEHRELPPGWSPADLRVEALRRMHLRAAWRGPRAEGAALFVQVADVRGETLPLHRFRAGGSSSTSLAPLSEEGLSEVLAVAETAAEVRVLSDGRVLGRSPLALSSALAVNEVEVHAD